MAPPVFKTRARASAGLCEVTLLAKSRVSRRSWLRWITLWELGVGTQWALEGSRPAQNQGSARAQERQAGSLGHNDMALEQNAETVHQAAPLVGWGRPPHPRSDVTRLNDSLSDVCTSTTVGLSLANAACSAGAS